MAVNEYDTLAVQPGHAAEPGSYDALIQQSTDQKPDESDGYDALVKQVGSGAETRRRVQLLNAVKTDPDQYAKAKQLERSTGVPAEVVHRNFSEVSARDTYDTALRTVANSPVLANHVEANGEFTKQGIDDLGVLAQIGNSISRGWRTLKETIPAALVANRASAQQQFDAVDRGETVPLGAAGEAYAAASPEDRATFRQNFASQLPQAITQGATTVARLESEKRSFPTPSTVRAIHEAPTTWETIKAIGRHPIDYVSSGAPEGVIGSLPALVGSFLSSSAGPAGPTTVMSVSNAIQTLGPSIVDELGRHGVDTTNPDAIDAALRDPQISQPAIDAAVKRASVAGLFGLVSGGLAARFGMKVNIPGQAAINVAQPVVAGAVTGEPVTPAEIIGGGLAGFASAPGEVLAAHFGRVNKVVTKAAEPVIERNAQAHQAVADAQTLTQISDTVAQSKLRPRDPQAFQQFAERAIAESGGTAPEHVYVSAKDLSDAMDKLTPEQAVQIKQLPLALAEQIDVANIAGADLQVPFSEFATHLAGTPIGEALIPHLRTSPEAMTGAEALTRKPVVELAQNLASMTPEEIARTINADSVQPAIEARDARTLRDVRMLSNAKSAPLKELQADAVAKREAIRAEVAPEVGNQPVYRALEFIKGDPTNKLSVKALRETYGEGADALWRMLPTNLKSAEFGLHPKELSELFGFRSGDHLVRSILEAPHIDEAINAATDQRMLERHGDLFDTQRLERAAEASVAHEARARTLATELAALDNATGSEARISRQSREYAEGFTANQKIRDLKPGQFTVAEARAERDATQAWKTGDTATAAAKKREQLVSNRLARSTVDAADEVQTGLNYLRKFDKDTTRKAIGGDYADQIDSLLERFDLRSGVSLREIDKRKSLLEWMKGQEEEGLTPDIPDALLSEANRRSYKDMTVADFRDLVNTVKQIDHLGRLKQHLLTVQDQRAFAEQVTTAGESIRGNATRTIKEKIETDLPKDRFGKWLTSFLVSHRKFSSLIRQMDGLKDGGPLWDLLVRNMNVAGDREAVMRERATVELHKIFEPLNKRGKLFEAMEVPGVGSLTKAGRLSIALNWGNETNRLRVLEGNRWSESQARAVLDTLSKEDWQFVQQVWDHIDGYFPLVAEKEKRVYGVAPEKVEASPVHTKFGELRGGYYPIKYDPRKSTKAEADTLAESVKQSMQGLYTRATTRRGHAKSRVESVDRALRTDLGVVFQHVTEVIHDLSWHEYLIDANRLLRSNEIDQAIRDHYGPEVLSTMRAVMNDIAAGDIPATGAFDRAMNYIRSGSTVAGLGWNLLTALQQPLGLTQSMVRVGPKWIAKGVGQWLGDASRMQNTVAAINEKSDFMRLRAKTFQREVNEIRNRIEAEGSPLKNAAADVRNSFYYLITKGQLIADVPTWLGAYAKAQDGGHDEGKSIALADQAVLDAQGGGQLKDLAAVQRGDAMKKAWTSFYSFFNTTFNLLAERSGRTDFKSAKSVGALAVDYLMLTTVPASLGMVLTDLAKGDTKGYDDGESVLKKLLAANAGYLSSTMVGAREFAGLFSGYDYSGPVVTRIVGESLKLAEAIGSAADEGEVASEKLWKHIINVGGVLFHYPAAQVNRTWTGIEAVIHDGAPLSSVLFGPPKK